MSVLRDSYDESAILSNIRIAYMICFTLLWKGGYHANNFQGIAGIPCGSSFPTIAFPHQENPLVKK